MITLNTEKGILRIEAWEQITGRVDYLSPIDPKVNKLKDVLGDYEFTEKVNCGLPCNQPHLRGYVVSTQDGYVTNIGRVCGKVHYGLDFVQARKTFQSDRDRFLKREIVRALKDRLPAIRERHRSIKVGGATWVYDKTRPLLVYGKLPRAVFDQIRNMIRNRSPSITVSRALSEQERQLRKAAVGPGNGKQVPMVEEVQIGTLQGFAALLPDRDLRQLLVGDIEQLMKLADEVDENTAKESVLTKLSKWSGEVDGTLNLAAEVTALGKQLLTQSNLYVLMQLLTSSDDQAALRAYLSGLPKTWAGASV